MKRVVVCITDQSVGTENIPSGVEIEVRDYRKVAVGFGTMDDMLVDMDGKYYVETVFRHPLAEGDPLSYRCRSCNRWSLAPEGTDPMDLEYTGRYCNACGGNTIETPCGTAPDREPT